MTGSAAGAVADTYFEAWQARDFARLHSILADDATWFDLPTAQAGPLQLAE
jgi:ketosteroid isomerase-like protein